MDRSAPPTNTATMSPIPTAATTPTMAKADTTGATTTPNNVTPTLRALDSADQPVAMRQKTHAWMASSTSAWPMMMARVLVRGRSAVIDRASTRTQTTASPLRTSATTRLTAPRELPPDTLIATPKDSVVDLLQAGRHRRVHLTTFGTAASAYKWSTAAAGIIENSSEA